MKLSPPPTIPLFLSTIFFTDSYTGNAIFTYTNCVSTIEAKRNKNHANLASTMDHSITKASSSNSIVTSPHAHNSEKATPGRYTCYDAGTFLAVYIVLATTGTIDVASEAFDQSEKMSKAHQHIEITDAHEKLARRPSRKVRRSAGEDQDGEKKKKGQMRSRIGEWLEKAVRNLKAE